MPNIYLWIAALVIAATAFGGTYFKGRSDGKAVVQEQWDVATAKAVIEAEKQRSENQAVIREAEKKFATRAAKSRIVTRTIIEKVDHYVPITDPMLSGGFRRVYDAAVTGTEIDNSSGVDAPAVAPSDVARNAALNYSACREDQGRLEALQGIVKVINGE